MPSRSNRVRILIVCLTSLCALTVAPAKASAQTTLNLQVSSNFDNADESSGTVSVNDDDLMVVANGGFNGIRFQNVNIPAGATISSATLRLHSWGPDTASFTVNVYGHDIDNSSAFSATANNVSGRTRTTAAVNWATSSTTYTDGQNIDSPNIASVIQEVVDRGGWNSGNALSLILTPVSGAKYAYSYYGSATNAPELILTYSTSGSSYTVLLVTANSSLTSEETSRKSQFESWGYTVNTLQDGSDPANFDTAAAAADVVYVPYSVDGTSLSSKLRTASIGVVWEAVSNLDYQFGLSNGGANGGSPNTTLDLINTTHAITSGLSDPLTIYSASTFQRSINSPVGSATLLGNINGTSNPALATLETGATLANTISSNSTASGKRVRLPFGGGAFTWSQITSGGLTLIKQSLQWAAPTSTSTGLIAHWKFDENSGSTISDATGNGNDATFNTGTPSWTSGMKLGALQFNGSQDADTDSTFDPPGTGSVAFWYKFNATPTGTQRLFGLGDNWEARCDSSGVIYFDLGGSPGGTFATPSGSCNAGEWHHVVAIYNASSGNYKVYLDGTEVNSGSATLADQSAAILSFATRTGTTNRFNGALDDFRVYDSELTAAQCEQLFGLRGHWKFDDGSGSTAADSSQTGNGLTASGSPTWTSGVRDGASRYTGSDFYHSADAIFDNIDETVSVACWFKLDDDMVDISTFQYLVECNTNSPDNTGFSLFVRPNNDSIRFQTRDGSGLTFVDADASHIRAGEWHHAVGVYDGAELRIYLDGQLAATQANTNGIAPELGRLQIGSNVEGDVDDVVIYDRAMTPLEIAEHHGLIAHWKLDDASGTTAADSSLAGNDATLTGTQDWTSGQDGDAHGFDYTDGDDYFEAPTNTTLNDSNESNYTVMAYFKPNSIPPNTDTNTAIYAVLTKEGYHTGIYYNNAQQFQFTNYLTGDSNVDTGTWSNTYPPGEFYHVAGVVDYDAGTIKIYVDGVHINTQNFTPGTAAKDYGTLPWRLGIAGPGSSIYRWAADGVIDDARIYNRALSDEEIAQFAPYSLIGHWKLDETSGTTAVDSSATGTDGTYTNGATPGAAGFKDYAADFDGVDDHITISGGSTYNLRNNLTVACWAKSDTATWSGWGCLVSKRNQFYIHPSFGGTGIYMAINQDGGGDTTASFDMANLGSIQDWHHYVGVYDYDAGEVKLYIDGILRATGTITPGTQLVSDTGELTIGWDDGITGTRYFDGKIDEVRLYREALTDAEVAELHGLVGHWKLDETSGSIATDYSGVNNQGHYWNGAAPGGAGPYPGDGDTAAVLEGSDEHVGAYPTETYDNINETMSVAAWVLFDNDLSEQVGQEKIIYRENYSGNAGFALLADQPYGDRIIFRVHDGSSNGSATWTNPGIKAGQWHHYAGTYDGAVVRLYVDGQLKASTNFASSAIVQHTPNNLAIGTDLKGRMFDARLYNRALINEEIAQLAKVAGHWTMDETSGVDSTDMTALSNQGSYENAPTLGINSVYNAENGTAVWFDGASSHVTIPHNAQMLADDGAVMFWFRSSTLSGDRGLFSKDSNGYDDGGHLNIRLVDGKVQARLQSTSSSYELESSVIPATKWQHVAFTWGSEGTKLYLNGRLVDSDSGYTGGLGTTSGGDGNFEPIVLAADAQTSGDQSATPLQDYLEGGIDDVRFYTRQFYEDQVYQIYRNGRSPGVRILKWVETR